jgi:hypothetical protein
MSNEWLIEEMLRRILKHPGVQFESDSGKIVTDIKALDAALTVIINDLLPE